MAALKNAGLLRPDKSAPLCMFVITACSHTCGASGRMPWNEQGTGEAQHA